MSVIAIINQKGGCGKTTTSINLSAALALKDKKVLLVDFDPQGHSSMGLGVEEKMMTFSLYNVVMENVPLSTAIVHVSNNLSLLPSNITLASLEQKLAGVDGREYVLKNILESAKKEFDYILIDCPPHLGLLSVNALLASNHIIVPIEPGKFGLDGLIKLNQTVDALCHKVNHILKKKYLLSMFDIDSDFAHTFAVRLKRDYEEELFDSKIHRSSVVREAIQAGKPVVEFDQHSVSFIDFLSLANEVILWVNEELIQKIISEGDYTPKKTSLGVCFMYQGKNINAVQISGSFNNWNPESTPMIKLNRDGVWYTFLPLNEGKHSYQYVIDGKFTVDPKNPQVETSLFGVSQSVIQI